MNLAVQAAPVVGQQLGLVVGGGHNAAPSYGAPILNPIGVGISSDHRSSISCNGAHPYVGIMVADDADGNPLWRCSRTLISSKPFPTAVHCTEAPAASATIWFAEDIEETPGFGHAAHVLALRVAGIPP